MTMKKTLIASAVMAAFHCAAALLLTSTGRRAVTMNEMELAAVYLQPIDMEPRGMGLPAAKADVHLEADIHAVEGNKNGFGAGEWIPYLTISYTLVNNDTGEKQEGTFMPMVAQRWPALWREHQNEWAWATIKVTYHIEPPSKAGMHRHTDSETGVGRWWKPFDVSYEFKYVGLN